MVAVVVVCVIPGRRSAAAIAGISAGVWFDYFLTKPYESFSIRHHTDIETTVLLIVVAVAVGEISARRRRNSTQTVIAHFEQSLASGHRRDARDGPTRVPSRRRRRR